MSYIYVQENKQSGKENQMSKSEVVRKIKTELDIKASEARELIEKTIDTPQIVRTPYSEFYAVRKETIKYGKY